MLLDALGTLVELEPPAPRLAAELQRRFGLRVGTAAAEAAIGAEISYYRAHLDEGKDGASLASLRRRCAEVLRSHLPPPADGAELDLDELTAALLAALRFSAYADAAPALRGLRDRGIRLIVVSNWDFSLHEVLGRLGIGALVDGVVTSAEAGARKPAPEIFRQALALARVPPERAVHVGDSVADDVQGAHEAGIEPVLVLRAGSRSSARGLLPAGLRTISSLSEI